MKRLEDLLENIPVGYLILRDNEEIETVNSLFGAMVGWNKEALVNTCFRDLVSPLYKDTFYYFFDLLRKEDSARFIETKIRTKSGGEVFVRLDGGRELGEDGHFWLAVTDTSSNKELEEKVRVANERCNQYELKLRQVMEHSTDVYYYQDLITRNIVFVSPQISGLLGYTTVEFQLMSEDRFIQLFLPEYRDSYQGLFEELLINVQSGERDFIEKDFEMYAKNGDVKKIRGVFALVLSSDNQISQLMGCLCDQEKGDRSEKELANTRLMAKENDAFKSAFLANMSHEMRTPLNSIIGFSSLLKEEVPKDTEIFEYVSVIESNGQRLLRVLNDVIAISKIESNQLEIHWSVIELAPILEEAYGIFYVEAAKKDLELRYVGCDSIQLKTDREKITTVIYNLIRNAVKYTNEGHVEYGAKVQDGELFFYVKDTGIGISQDKLTLIDDSFAQDKPAKFEEGIGLGLSMSKGIIQLLGGRIGVESTYGEGSLFYFTLTL